MSVIRDMMGNRNTAGAGSAVKEQGAEKYRDMMRVRRAGTIRGIRAALMENQTGNVTGNRIPVRSLGTAVKARPAVRRDRRQKSLS